MANEKLLSDGYLDFIGGQDASVYPGRIPANAYAAGINVVSNAGVLAPRWGFSKKKLTFPEGGVKKAAGIITPYRRVFANGKFQALIPYSIADQSYLIAIISGIIFLINQDTYVVEIVDIKGGSRINGHADRINWTPAGKYLVIFDFPAYPVILEGIEARRADPEEYEIPVSNIGTYNQNRLFIGNAGNEFTAGDPVGNQATPNAPITFEEVEKVGSPFFGDLFQLSTNYNNDPITAMGFLQVVDTSTGIGPLIVATQNAIYSYGTQQPRDQWTAGQFGSIVTFNSGIVSNRSFANVNSDLFFVSGDGQLRSLSMSRDEQGKWSKVPLSREVQNWLKYIDTSLIPFTFVTYFNNKIFVSANPFRAFARDLEGNQVLDYASGGMVVLSLDNVSGLGKGGTPAWDGLWTGVRPMDMCVSEGRCFTMSKDDGLINRLYEMDPALTFDVDSADIRQITSTLYTKQFMYETPFLNKAAHSIDLNMNDLRGDFKIDVKYKPAQSANYLPWREYTHQAPWRTCTIPKPVDVNGLAGHQFREFVLGSPDNTQITLENCDPVSQEPYDVFRKVQFKLIITGIYWELAEVAFKATRMPQNDLQGSNFCEPFEVVRIAQECNQDWAIGEFKSCQTTIL